MRTFLLFSVLSLFVFTALGQVTTGRMEGTVTDTQGAVIPGVQVKVVTKSTGQNFESLTDARGYWVIASLPTGTYRVTVSQPGFKTATLDSVKIDAGVPSTVNITLEVGAVAESVEVSAGAEILQTATATVTSTLVGRQLHELPFTSRNLTELIVTQPGSSTPGVPRSTSVYGLPQSALNVTLDGINIQDNSNKSSDGFFNAIFPRADAIEEMTIVSAAAGAESNAEGALSMKMVTRGGSNDWHGELFWQHRNEFFNSNFYFNNINKQPRDHIVFNQFGGRVGGPILKTKLFFSAYMEALQLPQAYTSPAGQTVLTPEARQGLFRYRDSGGAVRTVNLYTLAGGAGFPSTPDPIFGVKTLPQIGQLSDGLPGLQSRIASNTDYNRNNLSFQSKGGNYRRFPSSRLDWNATSKHHVEFIYNYQTNVRRPDGVNINTASPVLPGTGAVLNGKELGNQGGIAFSAVAAVRSTLTPRLTSELRFGITGGTVIFNNGVAPDDFAQWNGYAPTFNFVSNPQRTNGQTRRNTPLKQGNANFNWSRSAHLLNFGMSFTQVNTWNSSVNGTQFVPTVAFALATGDPANTGATNIFTAANFPGSNATNLSDAGALYALLTGRVSSIGRSVILDDQTRQYGQFQPVVRNQEREIGIYAQDSWRLRPGLTVNYGIRWDKQNPPINLNGIYTRPGFEGVWGASGVGHLFAPGVLTGKAPAFDLVPAGTPGFSGNALWSPSAGVAWVLPKTDNRPLSWLIGSNGNSVFRLGYAISSIREDGGTFSVWGGNQGRTITLTVDPTNTPANFGAPGSVLFRNGNLPTRPAPTTPSFPLAVGANIDVTDFSPNLKIGYVQSWNLGFQRELTKDTVLEVRYVGNHGTGLWRTINLNEVNVVENGFLDEFRIAQANLLLARQTNANSTQFAGGAGMRPVPIIQTALALTSDTTTATQLTQNQAGALANGIATNSTRMNRLIAAGRPANFFQVNPLLGGSANLVVNGTHSQYHGLQTEIRRRMAHGLLLQGSYVWSHATGNFFNTGRAGTFTTLRDYDIDRSPSPYDIRHALKLNWIYELPIGRGHRFLGGVQNRIAQKAMEGWQLASIVRLQSGSPIRITSGRLTFNGSDSGVTLNNITVKQLQDMMSITKYTNAQGVGEVRYFPQAFIDNTLAAFDLAPGKTVDRSQPYIGPPLTGQLAGRTYLYGPGQQRWDFALTKKTKIGERYTVEFRAQALNIFNITNFLLFAPGNGLTTTLSANSTNFGRTTGAYRDLQNTNDTGGRILEFVLRFSF